MDPPEGFMKLMDFVQAGRPAWLRERIRLICVMNIILGMMMCASDHYGIVVELEFGK